MLFLLTISRHVKQISEENWDYHQQRNIVTMYDKILTTYIDRIVKY